MNNGKTVFLTANSGEGFISLFNGSYDKTDGWHTYIIKGGPGTGKSSFMKQVAEKLEKAGHEVIYCPCTSDPDSLDGIIASDIKLAFFDGTAPHILEPEAPGICEEIINLGAFWNSEILRQNTDKISELQSQNKGLHKTASRYICAAAKLYKDNFKIASLFTDFKAADRYSRLLIKKYFKKRGETAARKECFLCGITPKGIVSFPKTVTENFKNTVIIEDRFGAVSTAIFRSLTAAALIRGYKTVTVKNPLLPDTVIDGLLIPELSLAFLSENDFIKYDATVRRTHERRFSVHAQKKAARNRTTFSRKIARELLRTASATLKTAKSVHDEIEKYYINAMDFKEKEKFTEEFLGRL